MARHDHRRSTRGRPHRRAPGRAHRRGAARRRPGRRSRRRALRVRDRERRRTREPVRTLLDVVRADRRAVARVDGGRHVGPLLPEAQTFRQMVHS